MSRRLTTSRLALVTATAVSAAVLLAAQGCGGGIKAPDLFILQRTGAGPHAKLTLLVNEEGVVHCNGRVAGKLEDLQIVKARAITEEIEPQASEHLSLAARPGSVLRYHLRDAAGTVSFADNSVGQPKILHELQLFVLQTAQQVCKLPE